MASLNERDVRPTMALPRAVAVALLGSLGALLFHRLDVAVAVTPIIVWLGWAALTRHQLDDPSDAAPGTTPVTLTPTHADMLQGQRAAFSLEVPEGCIAGSVVARPIDAALRPTLGAFVGGPGDLDFEFEPQRWGRFALGPAHVVLGEASGAWQRECSAAASQVQVRPPASDLVGGSGVARPLGIAGLHRSARRGSGTDVSGVREFMPGDKLRRINWAVSSRTQRLHVTETFMERDTDVLIVTDTLLDLAPPARSAHASSADASSLDATVRASAAIVQHYVAFGDRVALHDLGGRIGDLPPGTGARQSRLLLDMLSRANRESSTRSFVRPLPRLTSGTLVFALTPLLDDDVLAELLRLRQLGAELVVVDTFPRALGNLPLPGHDAEHLTEGWTLRRMEREATVERLQAAGVPVTPWEGPGSLAGVLMAMEASRSAPRMRGGRR